MKDLFKGELLRFRNWAIAAAVIHGAGLGFMARLVDLAQQPKLVYQVFAMIYAVAGALLGLYQMGTYRRPNHWLNLLHRPLHRLRIAGALCGAGGVLLAVSVALPIFAIAGYQEALTARVVDMRHWLLPVAALLIAACGYLGGAYAMLANRRYSAAAALLPAAFMLQGAGGITDRLEVLRHAVLARLAEADHQHPRRGHAGEVVQQRGLAGLAAEVAALQQGLEPATAGGVERLRGRREGGVGECAYHDAVAGNGGGGVLVQAEFEGHATDSGRCGVRFSVQSDRGRTGSEGDRDPRSGRSRRSPGRGPRRRKTNRQV